MFYKRINDVYLENVEALEKELGDADLARDPRMHDFIVPDDCLWQKVARTNERELGKALNDAMLAIERANAPKFDGILANAAVDSTRKIAFLVPSYQIPYSEPRFHTDFRKEMDPAYSKHLKMKRLSP